VAQRIGLVRELRGLIAENAGQLAEASASARFRPMLESLTAESNMGVQKLAISDLDANQEYWFKVAPKNGCAFGEWSNWMKAPKWRGKPRIIFR
jgi:hypothetical protein